MAQVRACIDEAAELGAGRVAVLSGPDPGEADRAKAVECLIRSLKELCAYGRERGIGITLEIFDRTVDKRCLVGPAVEAAAIAEEVRADYEDFGLMYDLSHPAYGDQHPRFGIPGGENDVPQVVEFLRALFEVGYLTEKPAGELPIVAFEVKPLPGESSELVIANAKRVWREAWARV